MTETLTSVFDEYRPEAYPYVYEVELTVTDIAGGTPSDPRVAEGWIKTKMGLDDTEEIRAMVARSMIERGLAAEDGQVPDDALERAVAETVDAKHLNGFKRLPAGDRDAPGTLYIEGRHLKAMLKESANIRWAKDRWGPTKKGTRSFFAEHVFVPERQVPLRTVDTQGGIHLATEPTRIDQRFVSTFRGTGIQYEEVVDPAIVRFTIRTDHDFSSENDKGGNVWALLFLTAESNGLGASRSQGYGTFTTTRFEQVS